MSVTEPMEATTSHVALAAEDAQRPAKSHVRPAIVAVHLGPRLPPWLPTTLRQARIFSSCDILLVAESAALSAANCAATLDVSCVPLEEIGISDKQRAFRRLSRLDRSFREGFWTYTSERFFVIESVIAALDLRDVLHIENDVMLYCSAESLTEQLSKLYRGIAATFDNDLRCVPGLVYFPSLEAAEALTEFYLDVLQRMAVSRQPGALNDMQILGALRSRGRDIIDHLPIVPPDYPATLHSAAGHTVQEPRDYSRHFDSLGMVFDAAALGQFLGGIDPRNCAAPTIGFVNESCVFDPCILRPRLVRDAFGRRVPVVETDGRAWPVANLHVHSKNVDSFLSV